VRACMLAYSYRAYTYLEQLRVIELTQNMSDKLIAKEEEVRCDCPFVQPLN